MTSRERIIRAMRKEETDRVPFFPKIFNEAYFTAHRLKEKGLTPAKVAEYLDCEVFLEGMPCPYVLKRRHASEETKVAGNERITVYHTPEGDLREVWTYAPDSFAWHPSEYPLKERNDLKKARYLFSDFHFELDAAKMKLTEEATASLGNRGAVMTWDWRTPVMALLQDWLGIEKTVYFLFDYREEMEELMTLMQEVHKARTRLLARTDGLDFLTATENTSTLLISPEMFRRYCQRELSEYAGIARAEGKFYVLHMCGQLKKVLPDIEAIPADAVEAVTSPPVGNTTLAEARRECPGKCIIGGTNAGVWLKSEEEIVAEIEAAIAETGGTRGVILSSGGQMPVACGLEKVKSVSRRLKETDWRKVDSRAKTGR